MRISVRSTSCLLSLIMAALLLFAATDFAAAKTKYKTYYVPTEVEKIYLTGEGGDPDDVDTCEFKYYKSGLPKSYLIWERGEDYSKGKLKRNKKGFVKNELIERKIDDEDMTNYYEVVTNFKSGRPRSSKHYTMGEEPSTKSLSSTIEYKYKKGKLKESVQTSASGDWVDKCSYNKKGMIVKEVSRNTATQYETTSTISYKYNKRGHISKKTRSVTTKEIVNGETKTTTEKEVSKYKYTYNKKKRVTKCSCTIDSIGPDGEVYTRYYLYKYHYKKVKVAKKYWKQYDYQAYSDLGYCYSTKNISTLEF